MNAHSQSIMQVSHLADLIVNARKDGLPVDNWLRRTRLHKFDLHARDGYIPISPGYDFLRLLDQHLAGEILEWDDFRSFNAFNMGSFSQLFLKQPDLLRSMDIIVRFIGCNRTNLKGAFSIEAGKGVLSWQYLDPPSKGREIMERISLAEVMSLFHSLKGKDWAPLELHLVSFSPKPFQHILPPGEYPILCRQHRNAVYFDPDLLLLGLEFEGGMNQIMPSLQSCADLEKKIESLLLNAAPTRIITLQDCSDYFELSQRSLHRALNKKGTSYLQIYRRVQYLKSLNMLNHSILSVSEISRRLGYQHPSHFIRFFKLQSGTTPKLYRQERKNYVE